MISGLGDAMADAALGAVAGEAIGRVWREVAAERERADALAWRLHEALDRIQALEQYVVALERRVRSLGGAVR